MSRTISMKARLDSSVRRSFAVTMMMVQPLCCSFVEPRGVLAHLLGARMICALMFEFHLAVGVGHIDQSGSVPKPHSVIRIWPAEPRNPRECRTEEVLRVVNPCPRRCTGAPPDFLLPAKRGLASRYAAKSSFLAFFLRSSRLANAEAIVARASVSQ